MRRLAPVGVTFSGLDAGRDVDGWPARIDEVEGLHMANATARAVLHLLGVPERDDGDLIGQIPIQRLRSALLGARARLRRDPAAYTIAGEVIHGPPRAEPDGSILLRPVRLVSCGVDEWRLAARLDLMEQLVSNLVACGATHVSWA